MKRQLNSCSHEAFSHKDVTDCLMFFQDNLQLTDTSMMRWPPWRERPAT